LVLREIAMTYLALGIGAIFLFIIINVARKNKNPELTQISNEIM
jgi:hypothetical protein